MSFYKGQKIGCQTTLERSRTFENMLPWIKVVDTPLKSLTLRAILTEHRYFLTVHTCLWKTKNTGSNLFTRYIHAKELRYKLSNFKNGSKTLYLLYCSEIGCVITRWVDSFVLSCIFRLMCLFITDTVHDFHDRVNVASVHEMSYK